MAPERLEELRDKVRHGYNLINSESREVFEHFGEPIDPPRKRCAACNGVGRWWEDASDGYSVIASGCDQCHGTGYEVTR